MEKVRKAFGRVQYNSPVILTYTLLCFAVLLLNLVTAGWTNVHLFSVYSSSWADPLFYIRLVGHVFGHADFAHFFNNFIIILLAGPMLEEKYGGKSMAVMIAGTAVVTGLVHVLVSDARLLGASGIGFSFILLSSFVNLRRGRVPVTLLLCVAVFIGREVVNGIAAADNVSQLAHIVGGLCGAAFGFLMNREKLIPAGGAAEIE